jgi:hypothetical protein
MTNSLERSLHRASASQGNPQVTLGVARWLFERVTSGIPWLGGRIFVLLVLGAGIEPHRFSPSATANALTNRLQEQSLFLPLL